MKCILNFGNQDLVDFVLGDWQTMGYLPYKYYPVDSSALGFRNAGAMPLLHMEPNNPH